MTCSQPAASAPSASSSPVAQLRPLRQVAPATIPLVRGLPVLYYPSGAVIEAFRVHRRLFGVRLERDVEPWGFRRDLPRDAGRWGIECPFCRRFTRFLILGATSWGCRGCHGRRRHGPNCLGGTSLEGCRRRAGTMYRLDFRAAVLLFCLRLGLRGPATAYWYRVTAEDAARLLGLRSTRRRADYDRLRRAAEVLQYDPRGPRHSFGAPRAPAAFRDACWSAWLDWWHPWHYARRSWAEADAIGGVYQPLSPAFLDSRGGSGTTVVGVRR